MARTVPSQDARPSVCPSVTRQYSVETVIHILELVSPSGSHTTPVFAYQTGWQYFDGDPIGAVECKGYATIANFDQYLALCRK